MAHAGEEGDGAGVGVGERRAGVRGGRERSKKGRGRGEQGGREGSAEPRRVRRRAALQPARPLGSRPRPRSASPTRLYNLSARAAGTRGIRPTQIGRAHV